MAYLIPIEPHVAAPDAMTDLLLANEPIVRGSIFLAVLVAMATWDAAAPRRRREIPRLVRWSNNLGVVAIYTIESKVSRFIAVC